MTSKAYELKTFISKSYFFVSNGWSFNRVSQHNNSRPFDHQSYDTLMRVPKVASLFQAPR